MILTVLAAGPQHGYGIMTEVERVSAGRVRMRPGTLYAALDRLKADRVIEPDRDEVVETRLRRYYRLTPAGARTLADEAKRLQANVDLAVCRLKLAGGAA